MKFKFVQTLFRGALALLFLATQASATSLENLLGGVHSLQAHFEETAQTRHGLLIAKGQVWIEQPGKFCWETESPNPESFISDGNTLYHYQPDLMQVTEIPLSQGLDQTPLMLLSGEVKNIDDIFIVQSLGPETFLLSPKSSDSLIQSITLTFEGKNIHSFSLKSKMGQETKVIFTELKKNLVLAKKQFIFRVPKGVDVVNNNG